MANEKELRMLIEKWRDLADRITRNAKGTVVEDMLMNRALTFRECADELEAAARAARPASQSDLIATWRARAHAWPSCQRQWTGEDMKLAVLTCADELEARAARPAEGAGPRKVWGHCGSCGGHEFVVLERCNGCGEAEILEHLVGDPVAGEAPRPVSAPAGWQPIETAPKNAEMIVVAARAVESQSLTTMFAYWSQRLQWWFRLYAHEPTRIYPTHWMPLPDPPNATAEPRPVSETPATITEKDHED